MRKKYKRFLGLRCPQPCKNDVIRFFPVYFNYYFYVLQSDYGREINYAYH